MVLHLLTLVNIRGVAAGTSSLRGGTGRAAAARLRYAESVGARCLPGCTVGEGLAQLVFLAQK